MEPDMFSPLDYWLRKTVVESGGNKAYHSRIHSVNTIAVNCFFQSTAEPDGPAMRALPDVHADSLWRKVLQASRSAGLPSTAIVGGGRRSANVPPRPRWRLPLAISKGHTAFKVGTGLIEEFLDDDSLLHLASVCKDSVTGSLRTTIEFVILMKRKLWSRDFLLLALQSGLAEHEMLSIVATAYRLLSIQGFRKPIVQWSKAPLRL